MLAVQPLPQDISVTADWFISDQVWCQLFWRPVTMVLSSYQDYEDVAQVACTLN